MNESHPCSSDGADLTIAVENPLAADLAPLFRRHWAEMHADAPPESNHALPREGLAVPEIAFFVARRNGFAVAMGALKRLCTAMPRSSRCMFWPNIAAPVCRGFFWCT